MASLCSQIHQHREAQQRLQSAGRCLETDGVDNHPPAKIGAETTCIACRNPQSFSPLEIIELLKQPGAKVSWIVIQGTTVSLTGPRLSAKFLLRLLLNSIFPARPQTAPCDLLGYGRDGHARVRTRQRSESSDGDATEPRSPLPHLPTRCSARGTLLRLLRRSLGGPEFRSIEAPAKRHRLQPRD